MMKVIIGFNEGIMSMAKPWQIWLVFLVATNMIAPIFFIGTLEAKVVLSAVLISLGIMLMLFSKLGYVRLLGIGHILWIPMIPWLWMRLIPIGIDSFFGYWLLSVIVLDSISLLVDAVDVARYIKGDRIASIRVV